METLASKCIATYKDDMLVFKGFIKKKNIDNTVFYDYFQPSDVPVGWTSRKEYEYFYYPTLSNLVSFIQYKARHPIGFTASFCAWANEKNVSLEVQDKAYQAIKDVYITDVDKVKALPELKDKRIPDRVHQKITSYYSYLLESCGVLHEQGLGKTKCAIDTYDYKKSKNLVNRCLVIAPLSVLDDLGWPAQIQEYSHNPHSIVVRGTKEEKLAILNGERGAYDFYLMNYEGIANIKNELLDWIDQFCMVILDESSKIKNFTAKRSKHCHAIGKKTVHKLILSGTPITQNAHDIFSQFLFLDGGDTFGTSYEKFLEKYFNRDGWGYSVTTPDLERINKEIFKKAVRFTKKEALDLPEKTYQVRQCAMTPLQAEYYKDILQKELIRLSALEVVDAQNILVTILRLQQIADGFISTKDINGEPLEVRGIDGPNPKLQAIKEILEQLGNTQVIIFSRFKWMHNQIKQMLDNMQITNAIYSGGVSEYEKSIRKKAFIEGKIQVLISIPQSGGYGMNLQNCSYMIYVDNSYSLQDRLQSEDRIHRDGMGDKAVYIDVCCAPIDKLVMGVLKSKKNIADVVNGDITRLAKLFTDGIVVAGDTITIPSKDFKEVQEQKEVGQLRLLT